ncbi:putative reverse transcriptase domain-containing protein [Tanacetum coccineum]
MSSATMKRIVTQRIANATKAIAVYEENPYSHTDKTSDGPEVKAMDTIIARTWNLVDRSLTSAKICPFSDIVPSTIDIRIDTLERDNLRLRGMLCVERKRVDRLQRNMSYTQKDLTYYGHFKYQDMPFGLGNTPEAFMDLLNRVYKPYLDKFMIVFIDDMSIAQANKEYEEHLRLILGLLKNKELYAIFSKCEFWLLKVQFLGHVVDSQGIHVDTAKIKSIKD